MPVRPLPMGLLAALVVFAACTGPPAEEDPGAEMVASVEGIDPAVLAALPEGQTVETLEAGRSLYVICSMCHGLDARGTALGPSLRGPEWIHVDGSREAMIGIIRSGVDRPRDFPIPMPPMGGADLDESELRAVVDYLDALARSG